MSMKDQFKASASFLTRNFDQIREAANVRAARHDGPTPSELWDDLHDLGQVDVMVMYEDGSIGRLLVDLRAGRVVRNQAEGRR
jgi:hypothetical protein